MFNKIGALLGRSFPLVKSVGVVDVGLTTVKLSQAPILAAPWCLMCLSAL